MSSQGRSLMSIPRCNGTVFIVAEIEVVLHPLEIVSVGLDQLGEKVGSLATEGNRITDAFDELLTQA